MFRLFYFIIIMNNIVNVKELEKLIEKLCMFNFYYLSLTFNLSNNIVIIQCYHYQLSKR